MLFNANLIVMFHPTAEIINLSGKFQETNQTRSGEYLTDFSGPGDTSVEGQQGTGPELAYLSFSSVAAATDNFSEENKLGQGGFGHVYRVSKSAY